MRKSSRKSSPRKSATRKAPVQQFPFLAPRKNWLEWLVFGVSCLLILGIVCFFIYEAATESGPPILEIEVGRFQPQGSHFALPVKVFNHGDQSAEQVHVEVVLETNAGQQEVSELQIQYLPRRASRRGWVLFQTSPTEAKKITARPTSFQSP